MRRFRGRTLGHRLRVRGVQAGYGAVRALHGVSIDVLEGETVALLGTNGNGKSTLLKCIMGTIKPSAGEIVLERDGESITLNGLRPHQVVDLGITMIPEGRRLFPRLTVEENLVLGAYRRTARPELSRSLELCYETFPMLRERRPQLAGSLSGGQQQMLAIARALMSCPKILLVDEPSVGLSPLLVSQTITKISELTKSRGLTVLMAEQNFQQTVRIADRGYIIVHGEIVFDGRSVAELSNNDLIKSCYLGT